jgi:pimeloyl-ACP methyl ester carboxylesterase
MAPMPRAKHPADGIEIEIEYETFGDPEDPPLLLVMGLGSQMVSWDEEFCEGLVDRGFFVIRFDNRDVGLSTKIDSDVNVLETAMAAFAGEKVEAPYLLTDMAQDAVSVLDDLDILKAHIVGVSMGGMIAQTIAIEHPERVRSLTSIMSTTGDPDVGQPNPEVLPLLLQAPPPDREGAVANSVAVSKAIGSPDHLDEDRLRARAERAYDRNFNPRGTGHQLVAILASGSRSDALRKIRTNTLVIHGDIDPLVNVSGGERTAEVIDGAELLILEGMGHDLPVNFWSSIIEAITALAARS